MVRLLRRVLRLGLLAGVGVGVLKAVKGRKAPDPWADSWVSTGPPGGTRPSVAPITPAAGKPPAPSAATTARSDAGSQTGTEAKAESEGHDGDSEEGDRAGGKATSADRSGAKAPAARPSKSTRKGPARKSPTGKAAEPPGERLWVPANDGVCPQSHPVKAKLSSKIFHTPSGRNYSRTKADRCYPDEASAQADGLRPPLR
ncbi:MAG TPA: hypothetical protein VEG38_17955 [Acidimicrobiia bacterium]|nr:hypothetical protein [Acidimicrobiia bacterium]